MMKTIMVVIFSLLISATTFAQTGITITEPSILVWDANPPNERLDVYHVFFAAESGGQDLEGIPNFIIPYPTTSVDLSSLADGDYYAVVVAVNKTGSTHEGQTSFTLALEAPPPPPPPTAPQNVRIERKP